MAEMRNEELILLRAEVELNTGNLAGAITDINLIRTSSGGLAPLTLTPASGFQAILTALLYERRAIAPHWKAIDGSTIAGTTS